MPQSLVKNYIHIVFSTKHRQPFIVEPFEKELHAYIGSVCNLMECPPIIINGYTDHIHILCKLSTKVALMNLVEKVKSHSSKWMKTKDESLLNFYWQNGYGAFSVSPKAVDKVIAYIANQKQHHQKVDFKEEYRGLLKEHQIEYDEQYVWD